MIIIDGSIAVFVENETLYKYIKRLEKEIENLKKQLTSNN